MAIKSIDIHSKEPDKFVSQKLNADTDHKDIINDIEIYHVVQFAGF